MIKGLKENVLLPLCNRLGTAAATWLIVRYGISADTAHDLAIGITAAGLIMTDLFLSWMRRKGWVN